MQHLGRFNHDNPLNPELFGQAARAIYNLFEPELFELAVKNGEGVITVDGALRTLTGEHTGRSANDKFVVRDNLTENTVWWDNNAAMSPAHFSRLKADMLAHLEGKTLHVQDLFGGADPAYRLAVRVVTESAWHALFIRHLLRRPHEHELATFREELTIIHAPSFHADPAAHGTRSGTVIALDFRSRTASR